MNKLYHASAVVQTRTARWKSFFASACCAVALVQGGFAQSGSCTGTDTVKPSIYLLGNKLASGIKGPGSSQTPYIKPFKPGIQLTSLLTVGDSAGTYKMAGIPDGLGAFDNGDGTFTVLMNHEIGNTLGIIRAHGGRGAFVSKWVIRKSDFSVISGSDLMQQVFLWDTTSRSFVQNNATNFSRFCSADLPPVSAFYNALSGKGTAERIFMNGEESGVEGRAMGHIVTGTDAGKSYELPYLGKFSWENSVASGASGDKTVVAGMDDGTGGQVYIYIGTKTTTGTTIEKAGLNNGRLYGVKVNGFLTETNTSIPAAGTRFELADLGNVSNKTGAVLNTESITASVTSFLRPEDGAWDPRNPNDFYFVTTNGFNSPTRMWRLRFDNILTPETGGTIEAVLTGTESNQQMFDNLSADAFGKVLLQEDPGNQEYIARLWQYDIAKDSLFPIAYHDSTRFITGVPGFLTRDEESSGIIDMTEILGPGKYLLAVQAHYGIPGELVEGGQLLAMYNPYVFGNSTARDTLRVLIPFGSVSASGVNLGVPATGDNCTVASVTNNAPSTFPLGTTIVTWTVTDAAGNTSTVEQVVIVSVAPNQAPQVTITSPVNNSNIVAGPPITLNANASDNDGSIVKVEFFSNGSKFYEDAAAPYQFIGENIEPGVYVVRARAIDNRGDSTWSDTVRVTVTGCTPAGAISAEGYANIPGAAIYNLTGNSSFPASPSIVTTLNVFEYGTELGDSYGARLRGYICPPQTGDYVFYLASDDQGELWLSTDDNPSNKRRIAYMDSKVPFRSYNIFFTQKSAPIRLVRGVRYYVETLQKEESGADHLSVAWQMPDGNFEGPIPGSRLSPYSGGPGGTPNKTLGEGIRDASAGSLKVTVMGNASNSDHFVIMTRSGSTQTLTIRLTDAQGRVIEQRVAVAPNTPIQVGNRLGAGIYIAEVVQGSEKRIVKLVKQ